MKIEIRSTANPDGTYIKHLGSFDPSNKAVFKEGMYIHKPENQFKPIKSKLRVA